MIKGIIPHSKPFLGIEEIKAVSSLLRSGQISNGEKVSKFERAFANFIGDKNGVAVNSGTAAIHLSLLALGVGKGDEVIIPSFVCSALLNAVNYVSGKPVIVDVRKDTFNIDPEEVKKAITKKTKAIIVPHLFGLAANIEPLLKLGVSVIEDCAQSIGALYKGELTGSLAPISVFSFYTTKVICTGEGGMVLSNNSKLLNRIRDLREYDKKADFKTRFNYKMTDLQASIGIEQLKKLPDFIKKRRLIAEVYNRELKNSGLELPVEPKGYKHIYYRYVVNSKRPEEIDLKFFHERGVYCERPVDKPLHKYIKTSNKFPVTKSFEKTAISVPIYPALKDEEIERILKVFKKVLD